jgi:hypothetical protein
MRTARSTRPARSPPAGSTSASLGARASLPAQQKAVHRPAEGRCGRQEGLRLHGLLAFYDEPESSLLACVDALADAGVDHLVAVDGAYELFPDAKPASPVNQHAAIVLACRERTSA